MKLVRQLLEQIRVLDLGPLPAPRLPLNASLHQGVQMLARGRRGAVVIVDGLRPAGIFTERDVLELLGDGRLHNGRRERHGPLREFMTSPPSTIRRSDDLREAATRMTDAAGRHLVVIDGDGDLAGLLTMADLMQAVIDQCPQHAVNLPPRLRQQYHRPEGA